jgi:hypothetical protein
MRATETTNCSWHRVMQCDVGCKQAVNDYCRMYACTSYSCATKLGKVNKASVGDHNYCRIGIHFHIRYLSALHTYLR